MEGRSDSHKAQLKAYRDWLIKRQTEQSRAEQRAWQSFPLIKNQKCMIALRSIRRLTLLPGMAWARKPSSPRRLPPPPLPPPSPTILPFTQLPNSQCFKETYWYKYDVSPVDHSLRLDEATFKLLVSCFVWREFWICHFFHSINQKIHKTCIKSTFFGDVFWLLMLY